MWITELSELNKNDNFTVKLSFLFISENSVILRYTRNIVQLNSWPNTVVTHSCAARIRELQRYLVIRDIFLIMKLVN